MMSLSREGKMESNTQNIISTITAKLIFFVYKTIITCRHRCNKIFMKKRKMTPYDHTFYSNFNSVSFYRKFSVLTTSFLSFLEAYYDHCSQILIFTALPQLLF